MFRLALSVGAGLLAFVVLLSWPESADACGGLFCSASAPVNQAAERIVFAKNQDGTVTAVVQIQYDGPSEEFAWVLPVPGIPEVDVSSDLAFTRLQAASNPTYVLTTRFEGDCARPTSFGTGGAGGGFGAGGEGGSGPESGPIAVLAEGNVGPYDWVVIQPDASYEEIGQVAVDWLIEEGYDVVPPGGDPSEVGDLLGSYLSNAMNLIAFRLTKGNDEGTIRPIRITYEGDRPMIPIRPTAVAANDDMGVLVWVLGEDRAVPINYRSLELNEALIDWLTSASNYNQVVIAAANQAGGQGFVTERAGSSADYEGVVVGEFEARAWEELKASAPIASSDDIAIESLRFAQWDGYDEVLEDFFSPEDVQSLLFDPDPWSANLSPFDIDSFLDALETRVIQPMLDTEELIASYPYVTRLYTTMSAPEMDLDPLFDFNPDLEDVSNVHNATRVFECDDEQPEGLPSRVELENGQVVRLAPNATWPFDPDADDALPANAIIKQLSTSGDGEVITDNRAEIDDFLSAEAGGNSDGGGSVTDSGSGGGCSVGHEWPVDGVALLALAGVFVCVRRRRIAA